MRNAKALIRLRRCQADLSLSWLRLLLNIFSRDASCMLWDFTKLVASTCSLGFACEHKNFYIMMAKNSRLVCFIFIHSLVLLQITFAEKSKLEKRLDAVEHLIRGEIYLLREKLERNTLERERLMDQLNETLEKIDKSTIIRAVAGTTTQNTDLMHLTVKLEENSDKIKATSEILNHIWRGFINEKKVRKTDVLVTQLHNVEKNQNDILKTQDDIIKNQNQVIRDHIDLVSKVDNIIKWANKSQSKIDALELKCKRYELACTETQQTHCGQSENKTNESMERSSIRLVGGRLRNEGRVEVNYRGRHGTICHHGWDNNDAKVVCRMLGYTDGVAIRGPRYDLRNSFGIGTGEILLDEVDCKGNEANIFLCEHNGIGVSRCRHEKDAAVRCNA